MGAGRRMKEGGVAGAVGRFDVDGGLDNLSLRQQFGAAGRGDPRADRQRYEVSPRKVVAFHGDSFSGPMILRDIRSAYRLATTASSSISRTFRAIIPAHANAGTVGMFSSVRPSPSESPMSANAIGNASQPPRAKHVSP